MSVCAGLSIDVAVRRWQASTDTLNHLKLSVIQQCGQDWFPNQMQLYYENTQLTADSLSLAQVTVLSSSLGAVRRMVLSGNPTRRCCTAHVAGHVSVTTMPRTL